jgi:hypothetical protein
MKKDLTQTFSGEVSKGPSGTLGTYFDCASRALVPRWPMKIVIQGWKQTTGCPAVHGGDFRLPTTCMMRA